MHAMMITGGRSKRVRMGIVTANGGLRPVNRNRWMNPDWSRDNGNQDPAAHRIVSELETDAQKAELSLERVGFIEGRRGVCRQEERDQGQHSVRCKSRYI
jgi:hypothetical protein